MLLLVNTFFFEDSLFGLNIIHVATVRLKELWIKKLFGVDCSTYHLKDQDLYASKTTKWQINYKLKVTILVLCADRLFFQCILDTVTDWKMFLTVFFFNQTNESYRTWMVEIPSLHDQ